MEHCIGDDMTVAATLDVGLSLSYTHSSKDPNSRPRFQELTLGDNAINTPPPRVLLVHTLSEDQTLVYSSIA